jgi:Heterokaryon incompatibility protein (HET)
MDHLDISASHKKLVVPCLCTITETRQPFFFDYPECKEWFIGHSPSAGIKRANGTVPNPTQVPAFLQEWLFFGLLKDALKIARVHTELTDFVSRRDESDDFIVTTRHLRRYLDQWAINERVKDMNRCIEGQSFLASMLKVVERFFVTHVDSIFSTVRLDLGVHLSILILAETLRNAGMYIWKMPETSEYPLRRVSFVRSENLLEKKLLSAGRCISETEMLRTAVDNTGLYIAATIKWPQIAIQRSHKKCTKEKCDAEQIDDVTYKTAHTTDCKDPTTCRFSSVYSENVASILLNGEIPVVRIKVPENQPDADLELEVISEAPYVAISHVWAHGLGNVDHNALPRCQLLRLKQLTTSLLQRLKFIGEPLIWIDTLCIPVGDTFVDVRKLAISKIAKTFKEAKQILVLDAELQQSTADCDRNEAATRVLCSGWMRRLWTLQEAVVTERGPGFERLYLQFKEAAVSVYELPQTGILSLYHSEKAFQELMVTFPRSGSAITDLYSLTRALRRRSTSKFSDEAICLASILGLDIGKVVRSGATCEARMCAFYQQITEIPQHILFHRTKCLQTEGYRWAPKSLIGTRFLDFDFHLPDNHIVSVRDEKGLHVCFPGFLLTGMTPPATSTEHFYFADSADPGKAYNLTPESSGIQLLPNTPPEIYQKEFARWAKFNRTVCETKELGVIWRKQGDCVLVRMIGDLQVQGDVNEKENWGSYLCRAHLRLVKSGAKYELESLNKSRITTRKMSDGQKWCVA